MRFFIRVKLRHDYNEVKEFPMGVALTLEQAAVVDRAIQAGVINRADDVIVVGVAAIRQRLQSQPESRNVLSAEEWSKQLDEWASIHSSTTPLLSDEAVERESIYDLRGL
jgi:hypothetical protein